MTRRVAALVTAVLLAGCGGPSSPSATTRSESVAPASASPAATPVRASAAPSDAAVRLVVDGLSTPVGLVPIPGTDASVVFEQSGIAWLLEDGRRRAEPFLDLRDRVVPLRDDYDERGLLGLAFDPGFATTGRLYVYYGAPPRRGAANDPDHTNRLCELRVRAGDPTTADTSTERAILEFEQPQFNHSGGGLGFGPDGLLYLGTGDGGGEGDASPGHAKGGNAQDPSRLNGKILRLDVRDASRVGPPEIFALGFRNPWRLAFEPGGDHRLIVSDVGYGRFEEVDVVVRGGNYGWPIREGRHCLDASSPLSELATCATSGGDGGPLMEPVVEYRHDEIGIAVVGGFVYRGSALPSLVGRYVFADYTHDWKGTNPTPRATLLVAEPSTEPEWSWRPLKLDGGLVAAFITGLGEGADGELFVLTRATLGPTGTTGQVLQLAPSGTR